MNRINLITLGVKNIKESLEFYRKIGFEASVTGGEDNPVIVFFKNEGSKLELFPIEELAKDINEENPPELSNGGFSGFTLAYNAKSENEVDEIIHKIKELGANVVKEPQKLSWGGYGGYFIDPDGYYWEVAYGSLWEFDDSNMLIIKD
ncbi:VOC family protein [Geomicrobium sediminis]|uniref:Lactoylglutathione lyase n=1 Tax=Geomicrobium sediminis TaxID=1347788 RepID=A0ABS2PA88_9BACL|nr:VOC family protein [Geomicrobium sediminis]MBM7632333.1 putative lactoylglutathione lyase [Geomicrobium sediminis]